MARSVWRMTGGWLSFLFALRAGTVWSRGSFEVRRREAQAERLFLHRRRREPRRTVCSVNTC